MRKGFSYKKLYAQEVEVKMSAIKAVGEAQSRIRELESQLMDKNMNNLEEVRKMREYVATVERNSKEASERAIAWVRIARQLNEALMIARFEAEMGRVKQSVEAAPPAAVVPYVEKELFRAK